MAGQAEAARERPVLGRRERRQRIQWILLIVDCLALFLATLVATYLRFGSVAASAALEGTDYEPLYLVLALVICATWLVLFWSERLYDLDRILWGSGEFSRIVRAISLGVIVFILATYALKLVGLPRLWTIYMWTFAILFVCLGRLSVRWAISSARRRGRLLRPTLLVGSNAEARHIKMRLATDRSSGLVLIGYLASAGTGSGQEDEIEGYLDTLGTAGDLEEVVENRAIDSVLIAVSAFNPEDLARMISALRLKDIDVNLSAGLLDVTTRRVLVREASGMPLILVRGVSLSRWNLAVKRTFDLVIAGAVVLVGMPLWILLAVGIKATSPGPVFFTQPRTGRGGRPFQMYKFRSMRADAPELHAALAAEANEADGPIFKMKDDPRVTSLGRVIRKFSLDEVPQLINVLTGEMSLVGPRPLPTYETADLTPMQARRHEVPPGLTGMWQVSGRSFLSFDEMIQLDLFYIENWSVTMDLSLLARTIPVVLFPSGAY